MKSASISSVWSPVEAKDRPRATVRLVLPLPETGPVMAVTGPPR